MDVRDDERGSADDDEEGERAAVETLAPVPAFLDRGGLLLVAAHPVASADELRFAGALKPVLLRAVVDHRDGRERDERQDGHQCIDASPTPRSPHRSIVAGIPAPCARDVLCSPWTPQMWRFVCSDA